MEKEIRRLVGEFQEVVSGILPPDKSVFMVVTNRAVEEAIRGGDPEFLEWWLQTSLADFATLLPKAEEYGGGGQGSADLRIIGRNQAELLGWDEPDMAVAQELGCWFYLQGKSARLISDYKQRRRGKADTWYDISIYSMMARRLQSVGRWP